MSERITTCPGALIVAGEHFQCDSQLVPHPGWAHSNAEAQAIWADNPTMQQPSPAVSS